MRFYTDYTPEIDQETAASLDLTSEEDAAVLAVVNPGESIQEATMNLMAPVVVNHKSHRAAQVVAVNSDLPLRAPLIPKS